VRVFDIVVCFVYTTDGDSLSTEQTNTFATGMNYALRAIKLLAAVFKLVKAVG